MDLKLVRKDYRADGIFGEFQDLKGNFLFASCEHAYLQPDGSFKPKVAPGVYTCKNDTGPLHDGMHSLHDGIPFVAFQLQDVPPFMGHPVTGILIHHGNYNENSNGCILIGKQRGWKLDHKGWMIMASDVAFKEFMAMQKNESFTLAIE